MIDFIIEAIIEVPQLLTHVFVGAFQVGLFGSAIGVVYGLYRYSRKSRAEKGLEKAGSLPFKYTKFDK